MSSFSTLSELSVELARRLDWPIEDLYPEVRRCDLDSMAILELIYAAEDLVGEFLPTDMLDGLSTVGELLDWALVVASRTDASP